MDPKRIELLRKKLEATDATNVSIFAPDFCNLVEVSNVDDEGLKKAAAAIKDHVGKVAIERTKLEAMLAKVAPKPSSNGTGKASGTQKSSGDKS